MEALVKINPNKERAFRQFLALMQDLEVIESAQIQPNNTIEAQNFENDEDAWSEKQDKSTIELVQQYRDLVD